MLWALSCVAILLTIALGWFVRPYFLLWRVERTLNVWYGEHRPFLYRWAGTPHKASTIDPSARLSAGILAKVSRDLESVEVMFGGPTVPTLRLRSRMLLLAGPPYGEAAATYHRATVLDPKNAGVLTEFAIALALRAANENRSVDYALALETMLTAAESGAPETLYDTALLFDELPMPEQAIDRWRAAVVAEKRGEWRRESEERLAGAERRLSDRAKRAEAAASFDDSAMEMKGATELALTTAVERWLPARAQFEPQLRRLATVLERKHHDRWLSDILTLPDSPAARQALKSLGAACHGNSSEDGADAVKNAHEAEDAFQKIGSPAGRLRARVERVHALQQSGKPKESRKALAGIRAAADAHSWVWIRDQAWLEELHRKGQLGTVETALEREQALESIQGEGYEGLRLRALGFLDAQITRTRPLRAWQNARDGIRDYWMGVLPAVRVHGFYYALAEDAVTREFPRAAVILMSEAVRAIQQTGYQSVLAYELSVLGTMQAQAGQNQQASATFSRIKDIDPHLEAGKRETFSALAEIQHAEAETMAGKARESLTILDRAKGDAWARLMRSTYQTARGNAFLRAGMLDQAADEFSTSIQTNRQNLMNFHGPAEREGVLHDLAPAFRGLTEAQLGLGQTGQALATWHEFRGGRLTDELPKPYLPPGTAMLTLSILHKDISGWLMDNAGNQQNIEQHWINRDEVLSLAAQLADLAADKRSSPSQLHSVAKRLYGLILNPFERGLTRNSTLIIDADGALATIPWFALEDLSGNALVERFAVVNSFGWAEIAGRQARPPTSNQRALIIADPRLDPDLEKFYPRLTGAPAEAASVQRKLPGSSVISGSAADRTALLGRIETVDLLHFAGHGISGGGFGALLLAPGADRSRDAVLTAREISRLRLSRLRLVFLSACSTAVGEMGTVNLDSLVRAFLEAGAGRVVGARWEIDSNATSQLSDRFYESWSVGAPPAEALRQAVIAVRKKQAHPYYWAGLQLYGAP